MSSYNTKECRCNCGYTCGRRCDLGIMECIKVHYKKDCDHYFTGPVKHEQDYSSITCKHCGMLQIDHDTIYGI